MNDKVKGIIIGGVVLAALGGTLAVMNLTGLAKTENDSSSETETTSSAPDESVQLVDVEAEDVKVVKVTNEFGGFTYTGAADSGKENCGITELKGLYLNSPVVADIGTDTAQLKAKRLAEENAEDLSKYGLSPAVAEFDVTFADGSERDFLIGEAAPDDHFRYLCEKGSDDVYIVSRTLLMTFLRPMENMINKQMFPTQQESGNPEFGKMTISRKDLDYDMVFEKDDGSFDRSSTNMASVQVMTEPIFAYLDGTNSSDLLFSLYGLTAIEAVKAFPDENDLKEYGLDDPACTVTFTGTGYDYKLLIGGDIHEENDKGEQQTAASAYYCMAEGSEGRKSVFKVDASALRFMTVMPNDIISTLMTWNMVTDVSELRFSGEANESFVLERDGDGDKAEITKVTCGDSEVDTDQFKSLYQYVLTCPTKDGICFEEPSGEAFITIDIVCTDGHTDTLELYKDTDRRAIVKLNGRPSYRIQSKWADRLLKNIEAVKNGGKVEEDY